MTTREKVEGLLDQLSEEELAAEYRRLQGEGPGVGADDAKQSTDFEKRQSQLQGFRFVGVGWWDRGTGEAGENG
jgi:hypothetical protein